MFDKKAHEERVKWFEDARFGMFIHWGLYSIPARGEWVRSKEEIPVEDYQVFFDEFDPKDFRPQEWAKTAKQAGMKYAVLTAKHHEGFCLFDSKLTDYKSTNTKCGRDLVREFLDAFRAEGIKVGLYYSLLDWHHPDYPKYGDYIHPMRNNEKFKDEKIDFNRYLDYMHGQIRELCTNYGKIDIFWFDFSYKNMRGETWRATELVKMIRSLQPDVILDNRLEVSGEGFGSLVTRHPTDYCGDFVSPEMLIPPAGIRDEDGQPVTWEACITMNNNWGYCQNDHFFKPADILLKKLVECVSKGGNLIVNVGPDANGRIPEESQKILKDVGRWMHFNEEAVTGCTQSSIAKPEYGRITAKRNRLYYHVMESQLGYLPLYGIRRENVKRIRMLSSGAELRPVTDCFTVNYPDIVFVSLGPDPVLPDPIDTVVEVELADRKSV